MLFNNKSSCFGLSISLPNNACEENKPLITLEASCPDFVKPSIDFLFLSILLCMLSNSLGATFPKLLNAVIKPFVAFTNPSKALSATGIVLFPN